MRARMFLWMVAMTCGVGALACSAFAAERRSIPLHVLGTTDANGVTRLSFDDAAYKGLSGLDEVELTGLPLDDRTFISVVARRIEVLSEGAELVVGRHGREAPMSAPEVELFAGAVSGAEGSRVVLGLSPHGCNGMIELDGQTHIISAGPAQGEGPVVYNLSALPEGVIEWAPFQCGADLLTDPIRQPRLGEPAGHSSPAGDPPCRVVDLAIETDYEYSRDIFGGNTDAAAAYALTLVAAVSETTLRDLNVHLKVAFLRVWADDSDPYTASNSWDRFFQYQDHWNANMRHVVRDNVHMFSALRDGSIGGLAYLPGVCQLDYDYAYSSYLNGFFPYPLEDHRDENWDVFVVGHEEGHNLGAPHTHDHSPPIDGCGLGDCTEAFGGTYMSYCHTCSGGMANIVLAYHARTISEGILPYLNEAPCDLTHDPECVGVDCGLISQLKAVCRDGSFKFKAVVKSSLPEGTALTLTRDGSDSQPVTVNSRGKAKAIWKNVGGGAHSACVDQCPSICGSTSCNP